MVKRFPRRKKYFANNVISITFAIETDRSLIANNKKGMDISELYKLFLKHPVVTTDSRDCPKGSMFFALKGTSLLTLRIISSRMVSRNHF